jgi:hypothetical protein
MINEEGGVDPEQFRMEAMFDHMDTIGKSILGLTIGCTQCHNHKYDPITQEEYYRMFAFLNNDNEPWRVVYTPSSRCSARSSCSASANSKTSSSTIMPTGSSAWPHGRSPSNLSRSGRTLQFEDDPTAVKKPCASPMAAFSRKVTRRRRAR